MNGERLNQLKAIVNLDYKNRHDNPQMYFTWEDLKWLVEQAELAERYKKEKKMYGDWVNNLQCKNDELLHRIENQIFSGLGVPQEHLIRRGETNED